jgi:hypothetical protein
MRDALVGVLGTGALAGVDGHGAVSTPDLVLDWWIGAHDRWHVPAEEASTRRRRLGAAPVWETTVRVPRGEVAHRAYGVTAGAGAAVAVEVENRSPVPLTIGLVARVGRGRVEVDGPVVRVDGATAFVLSAVPRRWATGASTAGPVMAGDAREGPVEPFDGPGELALLFPVPHRTTVRAAIGAATDPASVRALPAADAVVRGWDAQLERGLGAELPPPVGELVDAARADLLLAPRDAVAVAALEDWGFDDEAVAGWAELGWRARRRASRRVQHDEPWAVLRAIDSTREPARFLAALRGVLVHERAGRIDVLPGFAPDWLGQSLTVSDVPVRAGVLSFAVRWHGARPALLWDAPAGVELRTPALDPGWSTRDRVGETLLAEPPRPLLALAAGERPPGESIDAPGQFS